MKNKQDGKVYYKEYEKLFLGVTFRKNSSAISCQRLSVLCGSCLSKNYCSLNIYIYWDENQTTPLATTCSYYSSNYQWSSQPKTQKRKDGICRSSLELMNVSDLCRVILHDKSMLYRKTKIISLTHIRAEELVGFSEFLRSLDEIQKTIRKRSWTSVSDSSKLHDWWLVLDRHAKYKGYITKKFSIVNEIF